MSTDPRPARTKSRLAEAALALCAETGRTPSVSAIVSRAGTSRSIFYVHFESADELLLSTLDDALAGIVSFDLLARDSGLESHGAAAELSLDALLSHLESQPVLYRMVFGPDSTSLRIRFGDILARHLRPGFSSRGRVALEAPAVRDAIAHAVAHGMAALIGKWVCGDTPFDRPELVRALLTLFPNWTRSFGTEVLLSEERRMP
ncbi:TetR/AcrR family transcriptional regulator [Cryptosporangium aurantiacum]|uniref:Transcriptional regulator, TetR family n=1 Tax=Cryptosporangium aurantiacum TaxID=134849 RepID=A0A1M7PH54_9ACTN|nr:TetR/AcrR family transcriptional regulator [Cryptosporangium aurantiacum]SHN16421.1 transcriptional regulator, TetR family [Cryptosporangium aurantiacum]